MNNRLKIGFTLIELLVVIAIVGILSGLIIVGMSSSIQSANIARSQVFSNSMKGSMNINLISEWKFDGSGVADGNTATVAYTQDSWSGGNNCSVNGSPLVYSGSNCVYGSCLKFNGSTDYLNCGNAANLNFIGLSFYTVEAWVYPQSLSDTSYPYILDRHTSCANAQGTLRLNGSYVQTLVQTSTSCYSYSSSGKVALNAWNHIVATYDGANITFYINGQRSGSSAATGAINASQPITMIACYSGGSSTWCFDGLIDNVRIYKMAISAFQIMNNYYSGLNQIFAKGRIDKETYQQELSELINAFAKK